MTSTFSNKILSSEDLQRFNGGYIDVLIWGIDMASGEGIRSLNDRAEEQQLAAWDRRFDRQHDAFRNTYNELIDVHHKDYSNHMVPAIMASQDAHRNMLSEGRVHHRVPSALNRLRGPND